jgi:hypothetical protein
MQSGQSQSIGVVWEKGLAGVLLCVIDGAASDIRKISLSAWRTVSIGPENLKTGSLFLTEI